MKVNNQYNQYAEVVKKPKQNSGVLDRYENAPKISFKANLIKPTFYLAKNITYKNINKKINSIDGIIGSDGYLTSKIKKAGLKINNDELTIKQDNLIKIIASTIKYPFTDMPFDLINWLCKNIQKTPLHAIGDRILEYGFIKSRLDKIDAKKSYQLVSSILEQYSENEKLLGRNTGKLTDNFTKATANKITKTAKAYASRDERTLNRIVTGGIGAVLSAKDMYNISMLEKNDSKSAKKAEKDRREQEMSRVLISAGLTFLTLGAFDKFSKGNYKATAYIIAASTLFAEVVSRIFKHKPLIPLSPEKAAEIAQKQKKDKAKNLSETQLALNRAKEGQKSDLYKIITDPSSIDTETLKEQNLDNPKKEKRGQHIGINILVTSAICSAIYIALHKSKGEYAQKLARKALYESGYKNTIDKFLENGNYEALPKNLIEKIKSATKKQDDILTIIKDKITKYESKIDLSTLEKQIESLLASDSSKNIESILKTYKKEIEILKAQGKDNITPKVTRTLVSALYEGVTKIFKTLYTILSAPGALFINISEKQFKESEKVFDNVNKLFDLYDSDRLAKSYEKQLAKLNELFKKYSDKQDGFDKIAKTISTHTHNFEKSAETSELANFSRTLVTLIASYFYVNDFRNTVLIESEGKNTQRAREVMNDSISFKLCNFFFNGTLMNLFNSVFKSTLNGSLFGATVIAAATELTNEFLIRKTIARPMKKLNSREEIIEFERSQANRKGFAGWWTRTFKKMTGQKSLVEKYEASQANKK